MASSSSSRTLFSGNGDERQPLLHSDNGESSSGNAGATLSLQHILVDFLVTEARIEISRANASTKNQVIFNDKGAVRRNRVKANPNNKAKIDANVKEIMEGDAVVVQAVRLFNGQRRFADELEKSSGMENFFIYRFGVFMDFVITFFRSGWQVLSDVIANGSNVTNDRPDTHFNKTVYNANGNPSSGLSIVGAVMLGVMVVPLLVAIGVFVYRVLEAQRKRSVQHLAEQENEKDEASLIERLSERTQKALNKNRLTVHHYLQASEESNAKHTPNAFIQAVQSFFGSKPMSIVSTLWNRLSSLSYIFWLVWFPFAYKFGLAAASSMVLTPGGFFVLPIVLGLTFALGAAIFLADVVIRLKSENNPNEPLTFASVIKRFFMEPPKKEAQSVVDAELQRLEHEAKLLEFIKSDHLKIRNSFNISKSGIKNGLGFAKRKPKDYANVTGRAELKQRLLGSSAQRTGYLVVAGIRNLIGGVLTLVFITWLGSTVVDFFGFGSAAALMGDSGINGVVGIGFGLFTAISAVSGLRTAQLEQAKKVDSILNAPHREGKETKEQAFNRLYAQVEHRKALLMVKLQDNSLSVEDRTQIQSYLAKVDVFNDHLFENFEYEENKSSKLVTFFERAYSFLCNAQTGAFLARFFLLSGGLFAGAKIGGLIAGFSVFAVGSAAFWPFIIVALVLVIGVGVLTLTKYLLEEKERHRATFLNTLDARLYYLEKKNSELCELQYVHGVDPENTFEEDQESVAKTIVENGASLGDREIDLNTSSAQPLSTGTSSLLVNEGDEVDTTVLDVNVSVKVTPSLKNASTFFNDSKLAIRAEASVNEVLTSGNAPAA